VGDRAGGSGEGRSRGKGGAGVVVLGVSLILRRPRSDIYRYETDHLRTFSTQLSLILFISYLSGRRRSINIGMEHIVNFTGVRPAMSASVLIYCITSLWNNEGSTLSAPVAWNSIRNSTVSLSTWNPWRV
jgi:hypothetical protein